MTAPTAPSWLKLTEEQVALLEWAVCKHQEIDNAHGRKLLVDYRTLRAERDAKDAEIARLKEENETVADRVRMFNALAVRHHETGQGFYERAIRAEDELRRLRNGGDNA